METPSKRGVAEAEAEAEMSESDTRNQTKKAKLNEEDSDDNNKEEEIIIQAPTAAIAERTHSSVGPFTKLFYGEDEDDVESWTTILLRNDFMNEKKLCSKFHRAYKNDKDQMICRLNVLGFTAEDAIIIAEIILNQGFTS